MGRSSFEPCLPTPGTKVPDSKNWIHEIKHDGYRLIVQRDGKRVRLFTRNGHDWSDRYPRIVEAALCNRNSSFVIRLAAKKSRPKAALYHVVVVWFDQATVSARL